MEQELHEKNNQKMGKYIFLAIAFVVGIITAGVAVSYAYFNVSTTYDSSLANVSSKLDCINISYSEANTINLDYDYPISDTYALANVTPVTVTVKNNCSANAANVNYTLALTTLNNGSNYIQDNKIRTNIKRKLGTAAETTLKSTDYVSNLTKLTSGNAYTYLIEDLSTRAGVKDYTNKVSYIIDSNSVGNGITNTYKVYLWVDYYEGDTTHTGLNDNSTQGQNFSAAISLIINP